MSYYTTGTSILRIDELDLGLIVTARTEHTGVDKVVQCYLGGELVGWQQPEAGVVRFVLPQARSGDPISLLAIDAEEATTNHWPGAWSGLAAHGNRIRLSLRRQMQYAPGDRWRVYLGGAGQTSASVKRYEGEVFPGGRGATGWGLGWGRGGWGYSACEGPGWGVNWGRLWGFGVDYLVWTSEPLVRGTYPVRAAVVDARGNESVAWEVAVVVDTFARPARGLAVQSYDHQTDTLVLTFTPSEDL